MPIHSRTVNADVCCHATVWVINLSPFSFPNKFGLTRGFVETEALMLNSHLFSDDFLSLLLSFGHHLSSFMLLLTDLHAQKTSGTAV